MNKFITYVPEQSRKEDRAVRMIEDGIERRNSDCKVMTAEVMLNFGSHLNHFQVDDGSKIEGYSEN